MVDSPNVHLLPAPEHELKVLGRTAPGAGRDQVIAHLQAAAREVRRRDVQLVAAAKMGHLGGEFSITDVLVTLYCHVMNVAPGREHDPERDRFILSKGHTAAALYCTLAVAGFMPPEQLRTFVQGGSKLSGHPDRRKLAAVEANTGPLGHGLPIAVGEALGARLAGSARRVYVVLGDGEMQEGSNWEAIMCAGHQKLAALTAVVDANGLQQGARVAETNAVEPLATRFEAFGWRAVEVPGNDIGALLDVFTAGPDPAGRPTAVIARTVKGFPLSFASDQVAWHHKIPDAAQVALALQELEAVA
ncbi:MAG: transketolase [Bifidobacteriaceae bacterium]|jgi:transketolase|nr:transketolase [Bifidobacteriaceae bacterium]